MSAQSLSRYVALALIVLGCLGVYVRHNTRQLSNKAMLESHWRLTYDLRFTADAGGVESMVDVAIPRNDAQAIVLNEEFIHTDLQATVRTLALGGTRELVLSTLYSGAFQAKLEFELESSPRDNLPHRHMKTGLDADRRSQYLRPVDEIPIQHRTVQDELSEIMKKIEAESSDNEKVQAIFNHCSGLQSTDSSEGGDRVLWALEDGGASPLGRARSMVALCRAAKIPARLVTGFELRRQTDAKPIIWLEAFLGHHWMPFDPENGYAWRLPSTYLPIRWNGEKIVTETGIETKNGAKSLFASYEIIRLPPSKRILQADVRSPWQIFDLTRLPVDMHKVMSLMLLLPLGALITAIFRNLVGIRTFGTFAPALLALSFVYADWGTGLVILIIVMAAGVFGRALLERLHLLMVPRLSMILTIIILCVVFAVSFLDYIQLTPSAQAVLLPLVILTILIERLYVVGEEDGPAFALQLAVGTLVVAAFCYLLLRWNEVGNIMLTYPELHCFTLAAFIFIGRYTGYRLTELWRFRDFADVEGGLRTEVSPRKDENSA